MCANLKGGYIKDTQENKDINPYSKQLKDIHHRLSAFGVKRYGKTSHLTHSSALSKKRQEYSSSFSKFIVSKGLEGKLNHHMTNDNIQEYLKLRCKDLSYSSKINYLSGFNSFLKGLLEANVTFNFDHKIIDKMVKDVKIKSKPDDYRKNRAIDDIDKFKKDVSEVSYTASVLVELQLMGYRLSESWNICNKVESYYNKITGMLETVKGKGNHIYLPKNLSLTLLNRIRNIDKMISKKTYHNILAKFGVKSHDLRYTFSKREYDLRINNIPKDVLLDKNIDSYKLVLGEIAEGLNHTKSRFQMTKYYLNRA